jgi:hypothetical protein
MNNRNFSLPLVIVAIILGATVYKHFNFQTFTFKESWLDIVYLITFVIVLFFLFKGKVQSK